MGKNWFSKDPKEQLAGKTAIIMGGGSGIGKATAEQFAAAGANLMICGVPEQICLDTAEELRAEGANAIGMLCDGTKADMVQAMIDKTLEEFGSIDILVSTAGISLPRMNSIDVTEADWDKIFAVNLKANFFLATAVARVMKDNPDGGKMVIISSQRGISAMENIAPYSITKAAVMGMVRSLAVDFAKFGIQVNGIAPGYFPSELTGAYIHTPEFKKVCEDYSPMGRPGITGEMDGLCIYLASDASSFTTGQMIAVDGGWLTI